MEVYSSFLLAMLLTFALMPYVMRIGRLLNAVDAPGPRKIHTTAIPRVGGIAMVLGTLLPLAIWSEVANSWMLAGIATLWVFGIWDDKSDLDFRIKFLGQCLAVGLIVFGGGIVMHHLPYAGFDPKSMLLAAPFTLFILVGVTNAINLSDGLDGLAAGLALLTLAGISVLAYFSDGEDLLVFSFAVMGSIFGFLRYNAFPARVFMGDTGSQFLGLSVGVLAIFLTQSVNEALSPALPLLLIGVPIADTGLVMIKRLLEGRSPFSPDKLHIHHQLLELGLRHHQVVAVIYLAQVCFVVTGLFARYESDLVITVIFLTLTAALILPIRFAARRGWSAGTGESAKVKEPGLIPVRIYTLLSTASVQVLTYGIVAISLVSVSFVLAVPRELGLASALVLVAMLLRLTMPQRFWFLYLSYLVFVTVALTVSLTGVTPTGILLFPEGTEYVIYGIFAVAAFIAVRARGGQNFQTTPTDLLLVVIVAGLAVLPVSRLQEYNLLPSVVKLAILFYGSEIVLQNMKSRWNIFTIGMLVTLVILILRTGLLGF